MLVYYTPEMMALDMGRKAYNRRDSIWENPYYPSQVDMYRAWLSGWYDAMLRYELQAHGHNLPVSTLDFHPPSV